VNELNQQGGHLQFRDRSLSVPSGPELEIASVYVPPRADQHERRAFEEAKAAFAETHVRAYTPEEADTVGRSAATGWLVIGWHQETDRSVVGARPATCFD
jgi:hypothetical protein